MLGRQFRWLEISLGRHARMHIHVFWLSNNKMITKITIRVVSQCRTMHSKGSISIVGDRNAMKRLVVTVVRWGVVYGTSLLIAKLDERPNILVCMWG